MKKGEKQLGVGAAVWQQHSNFDSKAPVPVRHEEAGKFGFRVRRGIYPIRLARTVKSPASIQHQRAYQGTETCNRHERDGGGKREELLLMLMHLA